MYLEVLSSTSNRKLVQCAWNFMNDSLRSDVFMRFHPESIACACIYLAARQCQVPLPNNPPWFWIFRVNEDEIQQICLSILRLYARPKPNFEQLEKVVEELKRKQQTAKSKARGLLSDIDTPNSTSRQNSPKVSPNPTSLLQAMRKEKEKLETKQASNGEAGSDRSDNDNVRSSNKKRNHDHSEDSDRSRDSKSNSSSHSSQRSRSPRSESPSSKKHKRSPSIKKMRKQESFSRDKHKRKYRSKSRSYSRSPLRNSKLSKKSRRGDYKDIREQYKEKDYYREKGDRDYYRERDYYKERDYKERDYKDRKSYSPEKDRHRSRKHRSNGHRDSPIREKLDKHRR